MNRWMTRSRSWESSMRRALTTCVLCAVASVPVWGQSEAEPTEATEPLGKNAVAFDDFRLVVERNIFDPERRRREPENVRTEALPERPPTDRILLVGVLVEEATAYCFFESDVREYRGVAALGESLGDLRVAEIKTGEITLAEGERTIKMSVGMSLMKEGDGEWQQDSPGASSAGLDVGDEERESSSETASEAGSQGKAGDSGGMSDVMRRLMEKRKQELQQ